MYEALALRVLSRRTPKRRTTIGTPTQPERPEQAARRIIDDNMRAAGWRVQSADALDISAARGVAAAELPTGGGFADYVLYVDRERVGIVEAKPHGALSGAEQQTLSYARAPPSGFSGVADRAEPVRFLFQSNGYKTYFTVISGLRQDGWAHRAAARPQSIALSLPVALNALSPPHPTLAGGGTLYTPVSLDSNMPGWAAAISRNVASGKKA